MRATHQRGSGGLIRSALSFVRHVLAHLFSLPSRVFPRLAFASWFQGDRAMLGPHHHPPRLPGQARLDEARFFLTLSCVRALTIPRCDAR